MWICTRRFAERCAMWSRVVLLTVAAASSAIGADTDSSASMPLEEVIVTAQKREQALTDVPQAIQVTSGAKLAERLITNMEQISAIVPGLKVGTAFKGGSPNVTVRGIGPANQYNFNTNAPIGLYQDEVYQSFVPAPAVQFFDLERVEVLKGPQGTLYGRNTTGGAINFISRRPDLSGGLNGGAEVGFGNRNAFNARAAADVQFVPEVFAARFAVLHTESDGFMENVGPGYDTFGADDTWQGRATFRYKPSGNLDVLLRLYANDSDNTGSGPIGAGVLQPGAGAPISPGPPNQNVAGYSRTARGLGDYQVEYDFNRPVTRLKNEAGALTITWDKDAYSITSITAAADASARLSGECDGTPLAICAIDHSLDGSQFSQDLRVQYDSGLMKLTAGAFYGEDDLEYTVFMDFGVVFPRASYQQRRSSYASYVDGSFNLTDKLELTLGARETVDELSLQDAQTVLLSTAFTGTPMAMTIPTPGPYDPEAVLPDQNRDSNGFTGRAILKYSFTPDLMTYASFSNGYRQGAFNGLAVFTPSEINYVGPEKVKNYEVGLKATLMDSRVQLTSAIFHSQIESQHVLSTVANGPVAYPALAGLDGRVLGAELEISAAVANGLRINLAMQGLDSEYDDDQVLNFIAVDGNEFAQAPRFSAQAGLDWDIWGTQDLEITLSGHANYTSRYWFAPENSDGVIGAAVRNGQSAYTLVDGRVTFAWRDYKLAVWGKNLTDEYYVVYATTPEASFGSDFLMLGEPRTYGVTLSVEF